MKVNFKPTHKPTELESLLQTADPKEQADRVRMLMRPIFVLAITFDARTEQVSLTNVGPEIPIQVAHKMLDDARMALASQQAKQSPATESAPVPDVPPKE